MSQTSTAHSGDASTNSMADAVPDRLESSIATEQLHSQQVVPHREKNYPVENIVNGCKRHLEANATNKDGEPVPISKTKAVSMVADYLTTCMDGWFSHEFDQDSLEDLFWDGDSGGDHIPLFTSQTEVMDSVDPTVDGELDTVAVPLVGLGLTHGDVPFASEQSGMETAEAQRAIKEAIIEHASTAGLDESQIEGAVQAAKRDLRQL